MNNIYILLLILIGNSAIAQNGSLTIHGRVENENKSVKETRIELIKDNELVKEFTNNVNGSYKVRLELGSIYNITFYKEGYVSKTIGVIAKTPDSLLVGQFFFQLDVDLFNINEPDTSEVVFPDVAKLMLKGAKEGFVYDKQYVRWITGEFQAKKESQESNK
jgi:hypothetical protein